MFFGWGGWGRSRIIDEYGRDISLTDGHWIIALGQGGWTCYISEFGLLAMAPILLMLNGRKYKISMETSILSIILVGNLIDLIPNAGLTPITWMMAGALWGRLELGKIRTVEETTQFISNTPKPHRFSRYGPPKNLPISTLPKSHATFTRPIRKVSGKQK